MGGHSGLSAFKHSPQETPGHSQELQAGVVCEGEHVCVCVSMCAASKHVCVSVLFLEMNIVPTKKLLQACVRACLSASVCFLAEDLNGSHSRDMDVYVCARLCGVLASVSRRSKRRARPYGKRRIYNILTMGSFVFAPGTVSF